MVLTFPPSPKSDTPLPPPEEIKLFSKVKRRRGLERIKAARFFWRPFVKNIPDHAGFFLLLLFLADDDVRPNCHPRKKKRNNIGKREREVIKFLFGPPNGRERRYSTPKVGHKRKKRQRGGERIYELEKNVFFFFTSSSSLFFFPFFFSSLYPASVPENFSSSFHLCVCVTLVEREERAIGRPFSQLTRQTRYNRKRFFFSLSPILFLILF